MGRASLFALRMHFFEFESLERELAQLPPLHRVAFAAACCERLLPNYDAFCRMYDWGNPEVPRAALNEVWEILAGKPVAPSTVLQLREYCSREDVFPDSLELGDDCLEPQEVLIALRATLQAYIEPTVQNIIQVAKCARNTTTARLIPASGSISNRRYG